MLSREILDANAANAERGIRTLAATLFERLSAAVERGQRDGVFRPEIDPRFAAISVVAQVAYLMLARPVAGILLGRGAEGPSPDDVRAFGAHATDFALAALRRTSHPSTAPRLPTPQPEAPAA